MSQIDGDWLLDLGNTRLKLARLVDDRAQSVGAWSWSGNALPEQAGQLLSSSPKGHRAWLACSADAARGAALAGQLSGAGLELRWATTQARCRRLQIAYVEPARLGVDRFLALLAASEREDGPWLLVSVGSALTIDLLDADGQHVGGLIALSPVLHRQALAARIPHLDVAGGEAVDFAIDTADALASGALASALGLIERSLRAAEQRLRRKPVLLLTGGGSGEVHSRLDAQAVPVPTLAIDGLALYARSFASLPA